MTLLQSSLVYRDRRLEGFDLACLIEVIEHVEVDRLAALERNLFEFIRPTRVIVTTPNREYNACYPALATKAFRHRDHRFEWARAEFAAWGEDVCMRFGYDWQVHAIGPEHETHGAPTQMGVFER